MAPKISNNGNYILVESTKGINYWEILEGIGRLLKIPGYVEKHIIWRFHDGPLMFTYPDLYKIKEYIEQYYPEKKIALVAATGFQLALGKSFLEVAKDLPNEIKLFSDLQDAKKWIGV